MGQIQNEINGTLGTVMGAAVGLKHIANQNAQTKAIDNNTSQIVKNDKVKEKSDNLSGLGQNLQNAQANKKALESLLNAQYPYRNLKGWKPENQLGSNRLNEYNKLMESYNTAKEAELTAGLAFNQGLTTTLTEEVKDNGKE